MMRVVIDTNTLIRYLIRPSAAIQDLIEKRWLGDQIQMIAAPDLIRELEDVLARPYIQALIEPDEGWALLESILRKAEILPDLGPVPAYTRDPKDDKFVACALAGNAAYIVTTDRDLLDPRVIAGVHALAPHEFLAILEAIP